MSATSADASRAGYDRRLTPARGRTPSPAPPQPAVVGGDHDGARSAAEGLLDLAGERRGQVVGGLVEQQQVRRLWPRATARPSRRRWPTDSSADGPVRGRAGATRPRSPEVRRVLEAGAASAYTSAARCGRVRERDVLGELGDPRRRTGRVPAARASAGRPARRAASTCPAPLAPVTSRCSPASHVEAVQAQPPGDARGRGPARAGRRRPCRRSAGAWNAQRRGGLRTWSRSSAVEAPPGVALAAGESWLSTLAPLAFVDELVVVAWARGRGRSAPVPIRRGRAEPVQLVLLVGVRLAPSAGRASVARGHVVASSRRRSGGRPAVGPERVGSRSTRSVHTSSRKTRSWLATTHDPGQVAQEAGSGTLDGVVVEVVGRLVEQQARAGRVGQSRRSASRVRCPPDSVPDRALGVERAEPEPVRRPPRRGGRRPRRRGRRRARGPRRTPPGRPRRGGRRRSSLDAAARPRAAAAASPRAPRRWCGRRGTAAPGRAAPGRPGASIVPATRADAGSRPATALSRVVLPVPFSPTRPIRRPGWATRSTPVRAVRSRNETERSRRTTGWSPEMIGMRQS